MASILVIDDEKIIRERLRNNLVLDDYEVSIAADGKKGLSLFDKKLPQIVLVDVRMPGMDGIDVLRSIKEKSKEAEVIIITGHGGVETAIEALREGAFSYIQKPIEYDELLIDIEKALEKQEMQRKLDKHVRDLEAKTRELEASNEELKKTSAQLVQSEKLSALGKLTAGVAHELNQPLTGINYSAKNMRKKLGTGVLEIGRQIRGVDAIHEQVARMARIIRHLGMFGRPSKLVLQVSDINEIVRNAVMLVGTQLKVDNVELVQALSEVSPRIDADPHMLEQVVINLLTNARDAVSGRKKPRITLKTYEDAGDKNTCIEVTDNGCGIPKEDVDRLFEPFFTTKEQGMGTGLGLSICYGIVKSHRGDIQVESQKGKGTTFRIVLPLLRNKEQESDHG
ncbi:ATP-binding protein [Verrucomicrobiota bacterium]